VCSRRLLLISRETIPTLSKSVLKVMDIASLTLLAVEAHFPWLGMIQQAIIHILVVVLKILGQLEAKTARLDVLEVVHGMAWERISAKRIGMRLQTLLALVFGLHLEKAWLLPWEVACLILPAEGACEQLLLTVWQQASVIMHTTLELHHLFQMLHHLRVGGVMLWVEKSSQRA
jgi:hypothetical protein